MRKPTVLIVEDELLSAAYLKELLENNAFRVVGTAARGSEALTLFRTHKPDMILMDVMLKGSLDGGQCALSIRSEDKKVAILFLTAYTEQSMIDQAVRSAASGYLVKPYNDNEILATLQLIAARLELDEEEKTVGLNGGYLFNVRYERLSRDGVEIALGPRAIRLLSLLAKTPGISVPNERIESYVWEDVVSDQALRSLVHRIRTQLDAEVVRNVSGVGYMLVTA